MNEKERESSRADARAELFDAFWHVYPRKVAKARAQKVWLARVREAIEPDELHRAAVQYANARRGQDKQFTMHASTFLAKDGPWSEWLQGDPDAARPSADDEYVPFDKWSALYEAQAQEG